MIKILEIILGVLPVQPGSMERTEGKKPAECKSAGQNEMLEKILQEVSFIRTIAQGFIPD